MMRGPEPPRRRLIDELEEELDDEPAIVLDGEGRSFGDFAREAEEAAKAKDEKREEEIRKAQARFLYDLYKQKYPDILQIPREVKGFYFFEVDSKNAERGFGASKAVLSAIDAFDKDPASDEWKKIIDGKKDEIMAEYRIMVRPEKDYIPAAIERIADLFVSSPELRALASSFKVKIGPSARPDAPEDKHAEIIIYGATDTGVDADGVPVAKKNHERLLAALTEALAGLEPHAQKAVGKRMSRKVSDLISSAQSGGDFRGLLKKVDKARGTDHLGEYFDASTGYAYERDAPKRDRAAA